MKYLNPCFSLSLFLKIHVSSLQSTNHKNYKFNSIFNYIFLLHSHYIQLKSCCCKKLWSKHKAIKCVEKKKIPVQRKKKTSEIRIFISNFLLSTTQSRWGLFIKSIRVISPSPLSCFNSNVKNFRPLSSNFTTSFLNKSLHIRGGNMNVTLGLKLPVMMGKNRKNIAINYFLTIFWTKIFFFLQP